MAYYDALAEIWPTLTGTTDEKIEQFISMNLKHSKEAIVGVR